MYIYKKYYFIRYLLPMIKQKVIDHFKLQYKENPILIKSPGRINIIGEHTDYNLGFVLPASIDKAIYYAFSKNDDNTINIHSLNYPEKIIFDTKGKSVFTSFWGKYFEAIIQLLNEKGYTLSGVNCVFGGNIPIGAGLSSSAALCCGFIYGLSNTLNLSISKKEIAFIAQKAEHMIGLNCGIMDQYAVLFGQKNKAIFLDCKTLTHQEIPINLPNYSWVLINSNIKHELAIDSEYNVRRTSCENVVNEVKKQNKSVQTLRDVDFITLEKIKESILPIDYQRAHYILKENDRVQKMVKALKNGEAKTAGSLLLEGHLGMSKEFQITTPELDLLVEISQNTEGVLGSRMMGGGFGGCTINLIKTKEKEKAVQSILKHYQEKTDIQAESYDLNIDHCVKEIDLLQEV
ncbi:galactokinase [Flavobacteriaceae bacterium UJ101]|nr:galactokinase [Flavobacteriaceae bacterium UJ101]